MLHVAAHTHIDLFDCYVDTGYLLFTKVQPMPWWQLIHGCYGVNNIRFLIVYRGSAYAIVAAHTWMLWS